MTWLLHRPAWAAAGAAIAFRAILVMVYPALFGGDSVARLANADRVLLSYQLPALQAAIHALWLVSPGPWGPRIFLILVSGAAAAGFFRFAQRLMPSAAALAAALLFALNPFLVAYSIVPYQEMLMLAGLSWAFAWAFDGRPALAACALSWACLARYEAWLACPAVLWLSWNSGHRGLNRLLALAALYAVAPLAWMVYHSGVTPAGSFAIETAVTFERLWRWAYVGWIAFKHAWFALPAAAMGALALVRERLWREPSWQALLALGPLFAFAILLSAHGERDQPERFVTAREAHLPLAFICLLAGLGVAKLRRARVGIILAMLALTVVSAQRFVDAETSAPHVALAYRAARTLEDRLEPGAIAVVLAKPVSAEMLTRFLETAGRQGGEAGRAEAQRTLLSLHTEPPDYQRILVQTSFDRGALRSLAVLPGQTGPPEITPQWAVVWSDFEPSSAAERRLAEVLANREPFEQTGRAGLSLSIYRLLD
jgi:hypothetical protein